VERKLQRRDVTHRVTLSSASKPPPNESKFTRVVQTVADPLALARRLVVILEPRGRERFDASFEGSRIVIASRQAITDAARVLYGRGYSDDCTLVARHGAADHDAIQGPLGVWRKLRVREDRGGPRFVAWEAFPARRVDVNKRVKPRSPLEATSTSPSTTPQDPAQPPTPPGQPRRVAARNRAEREGLAETSSRRIANDACDPAQTGTVSAVRERLASPRSRA
jgi:hypothetical protein